MIAAGSHNHVGQSACSFCRTRTLYGKCNTSDKLTRGKFSRRLAMKKIFGALVLLALVVASAFVWLESYNWNPPVAERWVDSAPVQQGLIQQPVSSVACVAAQQGGQVVGSPASGSGFSVPVATSSVPLNPAAAPTRAPANSFTQPRQQQLPPTRFAQPVRPTLGNGFAAQNPSRRFATFEH